MKLTDGEAPVIFLFIHKTFGPAYSGSHGSSALTIFCASRDLVKRSVASIVSIASLTILSYSGLDQLP